MLQSSAQALADLIDVGASADKGGGDVIDLVGEGPDADIVLILRMRGELWNVPFQ